MPIEIVELSLRATINQEDTASGNAQPPSSEGSAATGETVDREAIVREAVDKVLEILRQERER